MRFPCFVCTANVALTLVQIRVDAKSKHRLIGMTGALTRRLRSSVSSSPRSPRLLFLGLRANEWEGVKWGGHVAPSPLGLIPRAAVPQVGEALPIAALPAEQCADPDMVRR